MCLTLGLLCGISGCRSEDEAVAEKLCNEIKSNSNISQRQSLEIMRRLIQKPPTAGTTAARRCVRSLTEEFGRMRLAVYTDEIGSVRAVKACDWAADTMEVFQKVPNPPFKMQWMKKLIEKCVVVVGRAWSGDPENLQIRELHERLTALKTN